MASYKDDKMTNKAFDLRALKPKLAIIIMMIRNRIEKFSSIQGVRKNYTMKPKSF